MTRRIRPPRARAAGPETPDAGAAPLVLHREPVRAEWLDVNDHMNVAYYVLAFDHATDAFMAHIGLGPEHMKETGGSVFVLETHVSYLREVVGGDPLRFATHLFGFDEKRIHYAHAMFHDARDYHAATSEIMLLHVDLNRRRAAPMPAPVLDRLAAIRRAHAGVAPPPGLSREIGLRGAK